MALATIDATAGGAAANSYNTLAEADAYFEQRPGGAVWTNQDTVERNRALLFATIIMDTQIVYWGQKRASTQALQFPRTNQSDVNGDPVIVVAVKRGHNEIALDMLNGDYIRRLEVIEAKQLGVRQLNTGDTQVRMVPSWSTSFPHYQLPPLAQMFLQPYIESGVMLGRA